MTAADQLALGGEHEARVIPRQRDEGTGGRTVRSVPREGGRDRWRVSGLFVQPREHNDLEEERQR